MVYRPPTYGILIPLPMVYRPPYPWYFDPSIYGIHWTPYPWYFDPHTHGIWPPYPWYIDPPIHDILTPLPMVFWPPYPWYIEPPTHGILPISWLEMRRVKIPYRWGGQFSIRGVNIPWGSKYHMTLGFVICVMFCRTLFVLLVIVLSVLRFMDSDNPFGIFKLFFELYKTAHTLLPNCLHQM